MKKNKINLIADNRKKDFYLGALLVIVESFFKGAPFFILYLLLLELFNPPPIDIPLLIWLLISIGAILIIQYIFSYFSMNKTHITAYNITKDVRLRLGEHLRKLPMGYFNKRDSGDLNSVIIQDVTNEETLFSHLLSDIVANISLPAVISIFLFFIDWRLALATVITLPIALLFIIIAQKLVSKFGAKRLIIQSEVISSILEYVMGIKVIKSFNQTGKKFERLDRDLRKFRSASITLEAKPAPLIISYVTILQFGFTFIILLGSFFIFGGMISIPVFLLFLVISLRFYAPLQQLGVFFAEFRYYNASNQRVIEVLDAKPLPEPQTDKKIDRFDIEFCKVSFSYDTIPVLQDVSFTVPQQTITALVGPSGAGKTTITNLITRFWDVNSGEVLIGGRNIKELKSEYLLSNISMVFQEVYLFNDTILNNIKIGQSEATREDVIHAAKVARCHEFIEKLPDGYDTLVGEGGSTLSGGEKQRISIARAILKNAPIILLDEATTSLDPENETSIQQAINELVKSKTLIIIAHRLSTITSANQILLIDGGRIIEKGSHKELVAKGGSYSRLWEEHTKAKGWKFKQN